MIGRDQVAHVIGSTAYDSNGDKLGRVGQVYFDDVSGEPEWATVQTGLFGTGENFVPLRDAEFTGDRVVVPHDKDHVSNAPSVGDDRHLSPEEERALYAHYGVAWGTPAGTETSQQAPETTPAAGYDTSGPNTDVAMTRSEERVEVGTRSQEVGRARLRKYVVTEQVTQTVPVTKERAVLETEPITDANIGAAIDGPAISEEEHEVVLHEEVPVVQKVVEPVERVRLATEEVVEEQTVTEEVRKERIEVEGDIDGGTTTR
jgi:stress response protein YsnF